MSEYTKGTLVSKVLNILEKDYDVFDLEDVGMVAAAEIEERLPLIAAAPDLLKACEAAYWMCDSMCKAGYKAEHNRIRKLCEVSITKAKKK